MRVRFLALAPLFAFLAGCPGSASHEGPSPECTKLEAQCTLGGGVLGVCSEIKCSDGRQPPCLSCMPQH